jgi:hypothetical protein
MVRTGFLAAVAAMVLILPLGAQTIGVPDNDPTMGTCNVFPMGSSTEWRYQQLIPASFLPAARFKITDMAYAPCASGSGVYSNFEVRMGLTSAAALSNSFDANLGSCPVTVLSTPGFSWTYTGNTWAPFGLQCAFAYDGMRNLVVEVRYDNRTGTAPSCHRDVLPRCYTSGTGARNNPTAATVTTGALKILLTIDRTCVLWHSPEPEQVSIGTGGKLVGEQFPPAAPYQIATALGHATQIPFGSCSICLDPDFLFFGSIFGTIPLFSGYSGIVAANGQFGGSYRVPNATALVGVCLSHAAISVNPICCSNTVVSEIVP